MAYAISKAVRQGRQPVSPVTAAGDPNAIFQPGGDYGGAASRAIAMGGRYGFFDPFGSPQLDFLTRQQGIRSAKNRRRRGDVTARLLGLDPFQSRAAQFGLERDTSGDLSNFLNEARLSGLRGNQDFIRSLFSGERGYEFQRQEAERQRKAEKEAQKRAMYGSFGSALGQLGGAYLGG